jgi:hypothetical protein
MFSNIAASKTTTKKVGCGILLARRGALDFGSWSTGVLFVKWLMSRLSLILGAWAG